MTSESTRFLEQPRVTMLILFCDVGLVCNDELNFDEVNLRFEDLTFKVQMVDD